MEETCGRDMQINRIENIQKINKKKQKQTNKQMMNIYITIEKKKNGSQRALCMWELL